MDAFAIPIVGAIVIIVLLAQPGTPDPTNTARLPALTPLAVVLASTRLRHHLHRTEALGQVLRTPWFEVFPKTPRMPTVTSLRNDRS